MGFPPVGCFWENPACHAQKMLLETVIIYACISTTTLPASVEVSYNAHGLE